MSDSEQKVRIPVEVVLAMPEQQHLVAIQVNSGSTVADAIEQSTVLQAFDGFELDPAKVGIFGRKASMTDVLRAGDRVEIYRPLIADPKESRRQRAIKQAES